MKYTYRAHIVQTPLIHIAVPNFSLQLDAQSLIPIVGVTTTEGTCRERRH